MDDTGRFLDGITVIDAASFIAGPVSTTVMADFGATVIKIEPPGGDSYRNSFRSGAYPDSPHNFRGSSTTGASAAWRSICGPTGDATFSIGWWRAPTCS